MQEEVTDFILESLRGAARRGSLWVGPETPEAAKSVLQKALFARHEEAVAVIQGRVLPLLPAKLARSLETAATLKIWDEGVGTGVWDVIVAAARARAAQRQREDGLARLRERAGKVRRQAAAAAL